MTNADVIRRMTDKELDRFLASFELNDVDYAVTFCDMCEKYGNELNLDCDGCRMYWLKSDAENYNGLLNLKGTNGNKAIATAAGDALPPFIHKKALKNEKYWWQCPRCKASMHTMTRHNFCHMCGQALKWGNEE